MQDASASNEGDGVAAEPPRKKVKLSDEESQQYFMLMSKNAPIEYKEWKPPTLSKMYKAMGTDLIGEGTYGHVFIQYCRKTNQKVAVKKMQMTEKEGVPITAVREVIVLQQIMKIKNPHIVELLSVVVEEKGDLCLVFEYLDHDLNGLIGHGKAFSPGQIKMYLKAILEALFCLHANKIIHRDVKGANVLISNTGEVKLADFGLARFHDDPSREVTRRVVTLWYRAPELLLGDQHYTDKIDMWSVGCLFIELMTGKSPLPGKDDFEQLNLIFALCGSPNEQNWPEFTKLPNVSKGIGLSNIVYQRTLSQKYRPLISDHFAFDLLDKMLTLDPKQRISASDALKHDYFFQGVPIMTKEQHPVYDQHCYDLQLRGNHFKTGLEHAPVAVAAAVAARPGAVDPLVQTTQQRQMQQLQQAVKFKRADLSSNPPAPSGYYKSTIASRPAPNYQQPIASHKRKSNK